MFICHREFAVLRGCCSRCLAEKAAERRAGREEEKAFNLPVDVALHHERQADVGDEIITIIKPSVAFIKQLIWFDIVRWGIIRRLVHQLFFPPHWSSWHALCQLEVSAFLSAKLNLSEWQESVSLLVSEKCVDWLTWSCVRTTLVQFVKIIIIISTKGMQRHNYFERNLQLFYNQVKFIY